jgi:DNA polymerase-3 subunit alpha
MAFATLEDFNGSVDLVLFSEAYEAGRDQLVDDAIVGVVGKIDRRRGKPQLVVDEIRHPNELDEKEAKEVHIRLSGEVPDEEELYQFRAFLFEQSGGCHVFLHLGANGTERVIRASSQLTISSRRDILDAINKWPQVVEVWKQ